ncbi:MAG TPA: 4Fe-4S dicluster domain-containing protein [Gemmatimonadales bacterium]
MTDDWPGFEEFPAEAELPPDGMSRRRFVQLLGASLALAGLGACMERPRERILPYVTSPPDVEPGTAEWYATSMTLGGYGIGLLVKSREGRPIKIEGNPDHPASLGAAGIYQQASLLQLYDPQRSKRLRQDRKPSDWQSFVSQFAPASLRGRVGQRGEGLHFLLEPTASPLLASLLGRLRDLYPNVSVHLYAPLAYSGQRTAAVTAFGAALMPLYDVRQADVILAVDSDFLGSGPFHLRYARDFAERRRPSSPDGSMSRLYAIEPVPSVTGTSADHRLRARAGDLEGILGAIAAQVILGPSGGPEGLPDAMAAVLDRYRRDERNPGWVPEIARDLAAAGHRSAVVVGESLPPRVHLLGHLVNLALGNIGTTIRYVKRPLIEPETGHDGLATLVEAMQAGAVHTLVMLDANPAYTAPAGLDFRRALGRVGETVSLGLFEDETGRLSQWHLPLAHYLESWDDCRAYDGTAGLVQPLIAPLYGGKTVAQVLGAFLGEGDWSSHDLVRAQWSGHWGKADAPERWNEAVQRGIVSDTAFSPLTPLPRWNDIAAALGPRLNQGAGGMELVFQADPCVYDGRFANNAWLQELPDPMTKLAWDNAALVSPATARRLRVETGDELRLRQGGQQLTIAALVHPGMADEVLGLRLGYGRGSGDESLAEGVGVNAYPLRMSETSYSSPGVTIDATGAHHQLARTQTHWGLEGRPIALHTTLAHYREQPNFAREERGSPLSLYRGPPLGSGDQWAMTIDLSACTGCSACVVACQAENNIPVVGKEGVLRSREMHWLRIDRYFTGDAEDPQVISQPMLCQHCEKAPCEYVCPVEATVHSPDGLNEMVYNRCVGTRFCSNNCPYKVRRFNWFDYNAELAETERMAKNPEVTIRARGVMEKCTFCVQRIRQAQIAAGLEGRELHDGEVRTACQQACPSQAIVFGSLTHPNAEVVRRRAEPRSYTVLHELGTEPRVRYLARLTNPNPALQRERDGG